MNRALIALALLAPVLYLVLWAPSEALVAAAALVGVFGFVEFSSLAAKSGAPVPVVAGALLGVASVVVPRIEPHWCLLVLLGSMTWFLLRAPVQQWLAGSAALFAGVAYCFLPWRYAVAIRLEEPWWLVYTLALSWVGDAAAFFIGKRFGRNKLAPSISPGKTWEGTFASIAGSVVFGIGLMSAVSPSSTAWKVALVSALANVAGQVGDLCESALKRGCGVKDSSTMLGSHGGWLDRVDANLFSIPVVWTLLDWLR